jgi:AraC-like DNA-binding protein
MNKVDSSQTVNPAPRAHPVPPELRRFLDGIWTLDATGASHRILPDGCMDFVFQIADTGPAAAATLVGPMSTAEVVTPDPPARLFGIRFRPGIAALFAEPTALELVDRNAPLESAVGPRARTLLERIALARTPEASVAIIASFLLDATNRIRAPHPHLLRAVHSIETHAGRAPIDAIARDAGLTARQTERLFAQWIGLSPKKFSRIIRLNTAVASLRKRHPSLTASALGYADQAHMIREFRALAGETPGKLLAREMSDSFNSSPR